MLFGKSIRGVGFALIAAFAASSCSPVSPSGTKVPSFDEFTKMEALTGARIDAPAANCVYQCKAMRQEFRYIVYVGKQIYCYWNEKRSETGVDFDALASELENSITDSTTPTEYYLIARRWASAFHDGHVNLLLKDDRSELEVYTTPIRTEVFAAATDHEKAYVVGATDVKDVKAGDEIVAVNGKPVSQVLDEIESMQSGSTKKMRRFFGGRRFLDAYGVGKGSEPLTLTLKRGETSFDVAVQRNIEVAPQLSKDKTEEKEPTGAENIKAAILPGQIGYLRIDGFSGSQSYFLLEQAMRRLLQTKGLLIDLRKNGGGDLSGDQILGFLTKSKITRYKVSPRMSDYILASRPEYFGYPWTNGAPFSDWVNREVNPIDSGAYAGKPVVALTSPNCFSACDTFTVGLKANGLATIVGENTGGGTGTPLVFDLPNSGHSFRYSVLRGLTGRDEVIEGVGTAPDVLIEATISDRTGADQQLARALEILNSKVSGGSELQHSQSSAVGSLFAPSWKQRLDVSPSVAEELELRQAAVRDEL